MAFNAQFFQLNPQSSLADDMSSGYKAGYEMREAERKKALQKTYSDMLTSAGTLPTEFIQEAAKKGIGMEGLEKYFENLKGNVGTAKQVAEDSSMLEMLGRTPDVGREWNGKPKDTQITITPGKEIKTEDPDMWGQLNPKWSANPVKPSDSISAAPMSDKVVEDEYNRHSGSIATLPPLPETTEPTATVSEPKEYSAVEEMLRRSGKSPSDTIKDLGTGETTFSTDLTKWTPADNGTNEYRQFADALSNELSANGFKTAEDYLTAVGKSVYDQNLYVPNPMAMYTKDGKLDRAAYGAEIAKQKQSQIVAKAKAEEAILKARDGLTAKAKEYGITTIDQRKLELPQGLQLRDSSKRTEAAALITNQKNIENAKSAIKDAGTDTTKLGFAAPQVIRAYATALNPGQQLSEGNLIEVSKALYPEMSSKPEFYIKAAGAMLRGIKNGDWSGFKQLTDYADAGAPSKIAERLTKIANEAVILNSTNLANYVIGLKEQKAEDGGEEKPKPESGPKQTTKAVIDGSPKAKIGKSPKTVSKKGRSL